MYDCSDCETEEGGATSTNYLPSIEDLTARLLFRLNHYFRMEYMVGPILLHQQTKNPHTESGWWTIGTVSYGLPSRFEPWWDIFLGRESEHYAEIDARLQSACLNVGHYSTTIADVAEYEQERTQTFGN